LNPRLDDRCRPVAAHRPAAADDSYAAGPVVRDRNLN
jgi:hypothetical protein